MLQKKSWSGYLYSVNLAMHKLLFTSPPHEMVPVSHF